MPEIMYKQLSVQPSRIRFLSEWEQERKHAWSTS